jgi:methylmalonyl-CoA mutase C-terminal domain/subunit
MHNASEENKKKKIRILLAKPGLDGHDRGIKILARELRDAGLEVIYMGLFQTVEQIVNTAIQEDVDVIGLSILDGGQILIAEDMNRELRENGVDDILLLFGGIIPEQDVPILKKQGVAAVFGPGSKVEDIVATIENSLPYKEERYL